MKLLQVQLSLKANFIQPFDILNLIPFRSIYVIRPLTFYPELLSTNNVTESHRVYGREYSNAVAYNIMPTTHTQSKLVMTLQVSRKSPLVPKENRERALKEMLIRVSVI